MKVGTIPVTRERGLSAMTRFFFMAVVAMFFANTFINNAQAQVTGPGPDWIFEERLFERNCRPTGGFPRYDSRGYMGCWIPPDRRSPWLTESPEYRYDAPDEVPSTVPPRIFRYPGAARESVDGTVLYIELVRQFGIEEGELRLRNLVEAQRQACMSATAPERSRYADRGSSQYRSRYSMGGDGWRATYDYRSPRYVGPDPQAGAQEMYQQTLGMCRDFNPWYERVYWPAAYGSSGGAQGAPAAPAATSGPYRAGGPGDRLRAGQRW